jgi:hypothetical protein
MKNNLEKLKHWTTWGCDEDMVLALSLGEMLQRDGKLMKMYNTNSPPLTFESTVEQKFVRLCKNMRDGAPMSAEAIKYCNDLIDQDKIRMDFWAVSS